jgi:ATP-binding protein involved in chromosome partitioning
MDLGPDMPLPVAPARGSLPVQTPQQAQAQNLQQDRMAQQFRLRMAIAENLKRIKHTVIVMSGKGGVGKTTVAVNLAAAFASRGWKVGLLDLDLTNPNVPHMMGVEGARPGGSTEDIEPITVRAPSPSPSPSHSPSQGRKGDGEGAGEGEGFVKLISTEFFLQGRDSAIVWRGPIKMNVIHQLLGNVEWGDLDLLVVDLPPGTGDEPLSIAQLLKDADGVVLVTTPQAVSILDVKKSLHFTRSMELPVLGIVENMATFVCPHCNEATAIFGEHGGAKLAKDEGVPLLGSIPLEPHVMQSGETGVPYVWRGEATATTKAFHEAVANVEARLKKQ